MALPEYTVDVFTATNRANANKIPYVQLVSRVNIHKFGVEVGTRGGMMPARLYQQIKHVFEVDNPKFSNIWFGPNTFIHEGAKISFDGDFCKDISFVNCQISSGSSLLFTNIESAEFVNTNFTAKSGEGDATFMNSRKLKFMNSELHYDVDDGFMILNNNSVDVQYSSLDIGMLHNLRMSKLYKVNATDSMFSGRCSVKLSDFVGSTVKDANMKCVSATDSVIHNSRLKGAGHTQRIRLKSSHTERTQIKADAASLLLLNTRAEKTSIHLTDDKESVFESSILSKFLYAGKAARFENVTVNQSKLELQTESEIQLSDYSVREEPTISGKTVFRFPTQEEAYTSEETKLLLTGKKRPEKTFELTGVTASFNGVVVHQIRATKNIALHRVRVGDLGGWVESEHTRQGTPRLTEKAWAAEGTYILGNASMTDSSILLSGSTLTDNAHLHGRAKLMEHAHVGGGHKFGDDVWVIGGHFKSENDKWKYTHVKGSLV